ncbi:MAG: glycosyltransferase family 4 protein [Hyphomonas sp.]|nr:glycosyltransferase family 4 protein [Hyphomonas sp.]
MRLLILTSQVSPYHNARYVGAAGHFNDIHVVSTVNAGAFPEFIARSQGQYALHRICEGREAYAAAVASGELLRQIPEVIGRIVPDAIAAAGWTAPESLAALEYGRAHGIPVIVMSESQADDAHRSLLREALKRRLVSRFDAALVGGPPQAEYVAALGIPRERIHYGYNAVENAHFAAGAEAARASAPETRRYLGLPERYILASARFIAKKNLPSLVCAYTLARKAVAEAPDLVILGDGPERSAVERAIEENGQGVHVHLPGFRGYDKLPAIYGLSEGFIHVSISEQWGLVINEAMASGVPVVASDCCGATRTVVQNGVTGFVTEADTASIAQALGSLFRLAPEQRKVMGEAASRAIAGWGPDRFGAGMKGAVDAAATVAGRGALPMIDRAILQRLKKKVIETVA